MDKKIANLIVQYDDGVEINMIAEEAAKAQAHLWLSNFIEEINENDVNIVLFMSKIDGWHLSIETLNRELERRIISYLQENYFRFSA